ncbi:MAG TPA: AraC family transcriptional regulator, partial [Parafilimonas sp.]
AKNVVYPEHWGPLSIKCSIKGVEHYQCHNRFYSVDKDCYLIFNNGQYYSSHIYSDTATESFTINFSDEFQRCVLQGLTSNPDDAHDNKSCGFIEKLYKHDDFATPLLRKLYTASIVAKPDVSLIIEMYYNLMQNLLLQQAQLKKEIKKIKAVKYSTQIEIYKRLNYAKDFIQSCYMNDISLDNLASVACMNSAYFLREFKKYFSITPYQCIMHHRLDSAKKLLQTTSWSVAEICFEVGYQDVTSFTKLFRKNFSLTPAAYRYKHSKKSIFTC